MNAKTKSNPRTPESKEANAMTAAKKTNAFADTANVLGAGVDALFAEQATSYALIPLDMIEVKAQIREDFEDEENTLADLSASIKARGVLSPILVRTNANGYELIAGERRYRASKLAGLETIPAMIQDMTDEDAEDAQMAENIHRKNLTQIEEAKKVQRDLNKLGSVEKVLEQYQKGRPWLSKLLSLLDLPEQAKRIVSENISADVEVINTVKTIEKADPAKAKALVDELSQGRGKVNAREKVAAVKEEVKPSKRQKPAKDAKGVATAKDRSQEEPSAGDIFAGAKSDAVSGDADSAPAATTPSAPQRTPVAFSPAQVLNTAYTNIYEHGSNPKTVLDVVSKEDQEAIEGFLLGFYEAGKQATDPGRDVIRGFRKGHFSSDGDGAFAMLAFLSGADEKSKFNVLNILGSVKDD